MEKPEVSGHVEANRHGLAETSGAHIAANHVGLHDVSCLRQPIKTFLTTISFGFLLKKLILCTRLHVQASNC